MIDTTADIDRELYRLNAGAIAADDALKASRRVMAGEAGEAYARNHDWAHAAPLLERAIRKQPFDEVNLDWMEELGGVYSQLGRLPSFGTGIRSHVKGRLERPQPA